MKSKVMKPTPVDSGWAWVILAGSVVSYALTVGSLKCFGLLYVELLAIFGKMASTTAVVPSVHIAAIQFTGLPANFLATKIGIKSVAMIGGLLCALGYFTTAFVPKMEYMYVTSAISGIGVGCVLTPTLAIVVQYFVIHRAKALSLVTSSSAFVMFGLPYFYNYVIEQYSMRGALILISGLLLHVCVSASLYRQPVVKNSTNGETVKVTNSKRNDVNVDTAISEKRLASDEMELRPLNEERHNCNADADLMMNKHEEQITEQTEFEVLFDEQTENTRRNQSSTQMQKFHFSLIKDPSFLNIGFAFVTALCGYNIVMIILPVYALGVVPDSDIKTIVLMSLHAGEAFSMLFLGWFLDQKIVSCRTLWSFCMTGAGASITLGLYAQSMASLCVVTAIYGAMGSSIFLLRSLLIVEILGLSQLITGLGLSTLFTGVGSLISAPLAGFLKDMTGSWNGACIFAGCLLFISAVIIQLSSVKERCTWTKRAG